VQSFVPQYRIPFFSRLVGRLASSGIDCVVVAGEQSQWAAARGHPPVSAEWLRQVGDPRELTLGHSGPRFYGYGTARHWRDCDGVIMTHRGTDVDLNLEILKKKLSGRRVAVWGHLSRSVKAPNPLDLAVERWQMRRSDHIFAYTRQGADIAIANGVCSGRVTAVMNSVDVNELVNAYATLTETAVQRFSVRHSLVPGKTFGYIGGIDSGKRIEFLAAVFDRIWTIDKEVKFLFAGRGNQEDKLLRAVGRGQVILLGYGGPTEKALIGRVSQALVNPGRIGLVAVDCLAIGLPILTTNWDFHAPEYDYLTPGRDVNSSADTIADFAELLIANTSNDGRVRVHVGRSYPTIEDMVENFSNGVHAMLA